MVTGISYISAGAITNGADKASGIANALEPPSMTTDFTMTFSPIIFVRGTTPGSVCPEGALLNLTGPT
jgi:hypothetical protein